MPEVNYQHKNLTGGRWQSFSFFVQMGNIGAEVRRAIHWHKKNKNLSREAFERTLELLDLTIDDAKNKKKLKELLRLREVLADYFYSDNIYNSSDKIWNDYFYLFGYAAALKKNI